MIIIIVRVIGICKMKMRIFRIETVEASERFKTSVLYIWDSVICPFHKMNKTALPILHMDRNKHIYQTRWEGNDVSHNLC